MANVNVIKSQKEHDDLIQAIPATALVVLNFHAPWAAPCRQMNQVFEELAKVSEGNKVFASIDAEETADVAEIYDVSAVPFFVLLRGKEVLTRISGADPAVLNEAVEKFSGTGSRVTLPAPQVTSAPAASTTATTAATPDGGADGEAGAGKEELIDARLAKLVKAAPVMLFMKGTPAAPQCGFSRQIVALLREREVRYGFFNILADDEVRQELKRFSDWPTYPQLYCEGTLIGGLDIVKEELANDPDFLKSIATP